MAIFYGPDSNLQSSFKTPSNMLCPVCGEYGRASFAVFVDMGDNKPMIHICNSLVCLGCKENGNRGRLVALFTGPVSNPDFSCRGAKLPSGITLDAVQQALIKNPTRRWFSWGELTNRMF